MEYTKEVLGWENYMQYDPRLWFKKGEVCRQWSFHKGNGYSIEKYGQTNEWNPSNSVSKVISSFEILISLDGW